MINDKNFTETLFTSPEGLTFYIRKGKGQIQNRATCLFFTASWHDSLVHQELGKFSRFLEEIGISTISCDLPDHPYGSSYDKGISTWKEKSAQGEKIGQLFAEKVVSALVLMEEYGLISLNHFALSGISRGCFIALYTLKRLKTIRHDLSPPTILFAPMLSLPHENLLNDLFPSSGKSAPLFLSIGNSDIRVGTNQAIHFFQHYVDEAKKEKERHIDATLHIHPSIGFMGHGTPDELFQTGAHWIQNHLKKVAHS